MPRSTARRFISWSIPARAASRCRPTTPSRVGLPFFASEFAPVGRGASGEVRGKIVTLDRVTLGGKSVENVSGAILEGSEMSLLGQSFLGQMGTIEITGDRMVIR